ncbi:MAG: hypothetical protein J7K23_07130 [Thermoproteales archaeon]|nr:hypothetical protein [Thermoproteales archaeon]
MKVHDIYSKIMNTLLYISILGVGVGVIVYYVNRIFSEPIIIFALGILTISPFIGMLALGYYYIRKKDYKTILNIIIVMIIALLNLINLWLRK